MTRGRENIKSQVETGACTPESFYIDYCSSVFKYIPLLLLLLLCREKPPVKEAKRAPAPTAWLQRDLKVRFIDKAFKGGQYYNSKVHHLRFMHLMTVALQFEKDYF